MNYLFCFFVKIELKTLNFKRITSQKDILAYIRRFLEALLATKQLSKRIVRCFKNYELQYYVWVNTKNTIDNIKHICFLSAIIKGCSIF